ncbi:ImmA/IrrE family metallo-endopeptidase [Streptomyces europaeiscabiei]|uniref:ImmA/IrrE family metallo-endopeptidase n=1 Tax=Streptomyces europaeiscabiei TaxID=146819 RepID=UPI002E1905B0
MIVVRWRLGSASRFPTRPDRRFEERVRCLGLPLNSQLTIEELCDHIGGLRQRPVRVVSLSLPPASPHGLWVSTQANDYIFVEERLVPVHQQQVILHEIGHVVCDHEASPALTGAASLLMPSLDPDLVRRVMGREHSNSEAEIEAEMVGSLIGQSIGTWTVERTWEVPPDVREIVERLATLESPRSGREHE